MSVDLKQRSLQAAILLTCFIGLGYFIDQPVLSVVPADHSQLKLVIRHSGNIIGECEVMTQKSLADKAANMRQPMVCPREKSPMNVTLSINNERVLDEMITPSGIHNDGVLALFRAFDIPTGNTTVTLEADDGSGNFQKSITRDLNVNAASTVIVQLNDQGITIFQPGLAESG